MKLQLQYGHGVIALPRAVLTDYQPPDASYLYVLLAICAEPARLCETELLIPAVAKECRLPENIVRNAVAFWLEAGILEKEDTDTAQPDEVRKQPSAEESPRTEMAEAAPTPQPRPALPEYPLPEAARIIAETDGLRATLDECQRIAGKLFSEHETARLAALYDTYALDSAYLLTVFMYCKTHYNKTTVSYVVKTALELHDDGIRTPEALDAYIAQRERTKGMEYKIRSLFGIGERALTKAEKEYLENWVSKWDMPYDVITRAYEITIKNIEKPRMSYVNKILAGWYENGIRTVEAVDAAEAAYAASTAAAKAGGGTAADLSDKAGAKAAGTKSDASYDLDTFLELAMKRSFEEGT